MCGFVGVVSERAVAGSIHLALQAIQHRGQDSAGIATMVGDGSQFHLRRGLGTVPQAITPDDLEALVGTIGLGHVRYPTIGRGKVEDTQPFFYRQPGVLMAHNGNVTNYQSLREDLRSRSIHLLSQCDVEPAMCEFADALMSLRSSDHTRADAVAACRKMQEKVRGSYSIVTALMIDGEPTLIVIRDPNGIRPAVVGRTEDGGWVAASESVALDVLDATVAFEPEPGEVVFLRPGQEPIREMIGGAEPRPCVFEHIYFARPDSVIGGRSVYEQRLTFGRALGERVLAKELSADVVVPVPDTARPAAAAMAESLGLPLREGFIKNRYSYRTFIMPDQVTRDAALRLKLNSLPTEVKGRRVLLVDDSIVRGTTLRRVIKLLRKTGATEVHLAIHAPPVRHPCYYGIDMSTEEELFASKFSGDLDELEVAAAKELGADSLTYLSVEGMDRAFGMPRCAACFDGVYPQQVCSQNRDAMAEDRRDARQR